MPKRGENIYKRRDGRWEGRYIYDRHPDGSAKYRSVYGKSYHDVRLKLQNKKEDLHRSQLAGCTMTVKKLLDCWLANASRIKSSSRERYRQLIESHIIPELGEIRVCNLTAEKLNDFINQKLNHGRLDGKGGLASKTVNDICMIIKSAIKLAKKKYKYKGTELDDVTTPSVKASKVEIFGESDTHMIADAVLQEPCITNLSYLLCLETGLRLGEVCALKWSDIDFTDGLMHIQRTVLRINYKGTTQLVVQTPKSTASERTVPLTAKILSLLKNASKGSSREAYILTGNTTKPMDPRTMQYRFRRFLMAIGVKTRGFHAMRHSFATRCIEHGMDAKSLSEVLGHASVKTTLQMYAHPSMSSKRSHMEAASAL